MYILKHWLCSPMWIAVFRGNESSQHMGEGYQYIGDEIYGRGRLSPSAVYILRLQGKEYIKKMGFTTLNHLYPSYSEDRRDFYHTEP